MVAQYLTPHPAVPPHAIRWQFETARGPGGQHVNKTATAVSLRVTVDALHLKPEVRDRLWQLASLKNAATREFIVKASHHRSQWQNRQAAWQELLRLLNVASQEAKTRKPTRPSKASKRRHRAAKLARSLLKANRRKPSLN